MTSKDPSNPTYSDSKLSTESPTDSINASSSTKHTEAQLEALLGRSSRNCDLLKKSGFLQRGEFCICLQPILARARHPKSICDHHHCSVQDGSAQPCTKHILVNI